MSLFLSLCVHTQVDSNTHTLTTVRQETSSFPRCEFSVSQSRPRATAAAFVPLFITTISLHLAVYLFSFNEPQFAADLEERWVRLKPGLGVFEELLIVLQIQYM